MTKGTILSVSLIAVAMLATPVAARERHGSARNYAVESDVTTAPGQVYLGAQSCNPGPRVGAFASAPWVQFALVQFRLCRLSGLSGVGIFDRYTLASLLEQGNQSSVRRPGARTLVMSPKASDIGAGLIAAFG